MANKYLGAYTEHNLTKYSLAGLFDSDKLNEQHIRVTGNMDAHYTLSIHESINVLMEEEPLSPRQVIKLIQAYSFILERINAVPRQWNVRFQLHQLTPELAHEWYTEQIAKLRTLAMEVAR